MPHCKTLTANRRRQGPLPRVEYTDGTARARTPLARSSPRIVVVTPQAATPSYCWRTHWQTGYDSAFSLLSKFALLNGLSAGQVGMLFISATCGRKSALVRQLNLDLRDPTVFDLPAIAELCETTAETVASGFVLGRFAASPIESTDVLRYCVECLSRGFHSPLYQLKFIPQCPIHHLPLRQSCQYCGGIIPYRLTTAALKVPFACIHCQKDWAPALRAPCADNIRLNAQESERLQNAIDVASMKSHLFGSTQNLDRHLSLFGIGRAVLAAPSAQRARQDYYDFIDGLVHRICPELPSSLESPVAITEVVHGHHICRPRILPRRSRGTSRRRHALDDPDVPARGSTQEADASISFPWDAKLKAIYPTYCALRRRVWRIHVGNHRSCAFSAAVKLWWDVEGEGFITFCPMAMAYLRWRMFWEGVRVPADLIRAPRHPPFGVLAWLCDGAPIGTEQWTPQGEQWLAHRVFAMDCIRNFYEWLTLSMSIPRTSSTRWLRVAVGGYCLTHWAAAGNDSASGPLRIFLDVATHDTRIPIESTSLGAHRRWHACQLDKVER